MMILLASCSCADDGAASSITCWDETWKDLSRASMVDGYLCRIAYCLLLVERATLTYIVSSLYYYQVHMYDREIDQDRLFSLRKPNRERSVTPVVRLSCVRQSADVHKFLFVDERNPTLTIVSI